MALTKDPDEMDMPCPCTHCGEWFDLHDGCSSEEWYPGTVICAACGQEEEEEFEKNERIEELREELAEAKWALQDAQETIVRTEKELKELGLIL
jgi:uncharacterized Zn finger protein (UPF0148 family)